MKRKSFILKYDFVYQLAPKMSLNTILDYNKSNGVGSGVGSESRQIGGVSLLLKQSLTEKWNYELSARKEISNVYKSPVLFSAGSIFDFTWF